MKVNNNFLPFELNYIMIILLDAIHLTHPIPSASITGLSCLI